MGSASPAAASAGSTPLHSSRLVGGALAADSMDSSSFQKLARPCTPLARARARPACQNCRVPALAGARLRFAPALTLTRVAVGDARCAGPPTWIPARLRAAQSLPCAPQRAQALAVVSAVLPMGLFSWMGFTGSWVTSLNLVGGSGVLSETLGFFWFHISIVIYHPWFRYIFNPKLIISYSLLGSTVLIRRWQQRRSWSRKEFDKVINFSLNFLLRTDDVKSISDGSGTWRGAYERTLKAHAEGNSKSLEISKEKDYQLRFRTVLEKDLQELLGGNKIAADKLIKEMKTTKPARPRLACSTRAVLLGACSGAHTHLLCRRATRSSAVASSIVRDQTHDIKLALECYRVDMPPKCQFLPAQADHRAVRTQFRGAGGGGGAQDSPP